MIKKTSKKSALSLPEKRAQDVKHYFSLISHGIGQVFGFLVGILTLLFQALYHVLKILFELFRSIWLGLSVFILAISFLILSLGVSMWLLGNVSGLPESVIFQERREQLLQDFFMVLDDERNE